MLLDCRGGLKEGIPPYQEKFLLQSSLSVLTLIRCPFHPVLPQWHVKDPGHSAKKCRWQITPKHVHTLDPVKSEWAVYAIQA